MARASCARLLADGGARQVTVGDLAKQVVVMLGLDQAQVIDSRRGRWCRKLGLRDLAVDVAADDERDRLLLMLYLAWTSFAAALNFRILQLNRGATATLTR